MKQVINIDYFKTDPITLIEEPVFLKHPIKSWLSESEMEVDALQQAKNVANLPFIYKHMAWMRDGHLGYGMPIGGVMATEGVVIPNAVGVDIGCGMGAIKYDYEGSLSKGIRKAIMGKIRNAIPMGFGNNRKKPWLNDELPYKSILDAGLPFIHNQDRNHLKKQLGTLGAGNHFIEIQQDQFGYIWVMVHSGSRNIGNKTAGYYDKIARKLNIQWHTKVPMAHELAFLPIETKEGKDYMDEMNWCVAFAKLNRNIMLRIINDIVQDTFPIPYVCQYDVAHNYARWENHFGKNVIVHRKGATAARKDEIVIIPGSQGAKSYIGVGLGNKDSFTSCSHGAGRAMSRTKAKKTLNLKEEIKKMDDQDIIHGMRNKSNLDEAMGAYKDIEDVMTGQMDLVNIKYELSPKAVLKG